MATLVEKQCNRCRCQQADRTEEKEIRDHHNNWNRNLLDYVIVVRMVTMITATLFRFVPLET